VIVPKRPTGPREFEPEWLRRSLDRYLAWGLVFIAVLIVAFPLYRLREPTLRSDAKAEQEATYKKIGADLFSKNCASCHGINATGGSAPTLNSQQFLGTTEDNQIELLVAGGVSGSSMSPWSQDFGGSLTSEQIRELVTFLRSLEAGAPSVPDWRTGAQASG
jgi:mono/diheme cytochrome c family protein